MIAFKAWCGDYCQALSAKNKEMAARLEANEVSLWGKSKAALVALAKEELGMTEAESKKLTIPELRLELKENRQAIEAQRLLPKNILPMNFSKLNKAALVQELAVRGLSGDRMTNPEMMRLLRMWASTATALGRMEITLRDIQLFHEGAAVEAPPQNRASQNCSGPPEPQADEFMMVEPPAATFPMTPRVAGSSAGQASENYSMAGAGTVQDATFKLQTLAQHLDATAQGMVENKLELEEAAAQVPAAWLAGLSTGQKKAFMLTAGQLATAKSMNLPVDLAAMAMRI